MARRGNAIRASVRGRPFGWQDQVVSSGPSGGHDRFTVAIALGQVDVVQTSSSPIVERRLHRQSSPVRGGSTSPAPMPAGISGSELRACLPGIGPRVYQGLLVVGRDGQTDNVVPLEDYVDGVVPRRIAANVGQYRRGGGSSGSGGGRPKRGGSPRVVDRFDLRHHAMPVVQGAP